MHTDIAQRRRAEQSVRYGMQKDIGVRVTFEAELAGDGDSAENQRTARSESMDVPAEAHAGNDAGNDRGNDTGHDAASSSARNRRARSISVGRVILMFRSLPCTTLTSTCSRRSTRLASSVP